MRTRNVALGVIGVIVGLKLITSISTPSQPPTPEEVAQRRIGQAPGPSPDELKAQRAAAEDQHMKDLDAQAAQLKKQREAEQKAADDACRENASCYVKHYWIDAEVMCGHFVEQRAKYDFKWTEGWGEEKFDRMDTAWDNYAGAVVRLTGNHIRFQNGFGAFSRMRYSCAYDTTTRLVQRVEVDDD